MDCSICKTSSTFHRYGVPTYTMCGACYEGAKSIIELINKLESENENTKASTSSHSPTSLCKSLSNASNWVVGLTEKQSFLHGLVNSYRNRILSNILLQPGNNGSPIAAPRALLASRSKIFKNMLESDTCEALPLETITLPELNHEELDALLEFLYHGSLPKEELEKHIYTLSLAAHKYEIIHLQQFCQNYMLKSLHCRNALLILEISDFSSFQTIRDDTLSFIVEHKKEIIFSAEYKGFVVKNPHLNVEITTALVEAMENRFYNVG